MKYTYTALSKEGKTIHAELEAPNREAVLANLQHQELHPLVVKEVKKKKLDIVLFTPHHAKSKDIVMFTRQLSTMVSAGVPLNRALSTLESQTENPYFKQVLNSVGHNVQSGNPLADSFAQFPDVFTDVYVNMVRSGESGGILDDVLKRLATQLEKDSSMKKTVRSAMVYPSVILTLTVFSFFGIMIFGIPRIAKIITDLTGDANSLPTLTKIMLGISNAFVNQSLVPHVPNAVFIFAGMAAGVYVLRRYVKTPAGKLKFHALLLRTPIVKVIITKVAIARFSRTFSSLMAAGVGVLEALEVTGGVIGNKVIEAELTLAAKEVRNGKQLSQPLSESKHFPPIVSQMVAVGEETGQIDTILVKVADFYEEEVTNFIDGISSIIEPMMIIVLGVMVALIAASVMGPIANLSKDLGS